ncbi:hypothetical protein N1851_017078 [Merluccius polli]|uniref:Uncharacterized protein n=1 Tax=Merluccius polli TaxID=89951 RepID=A0AA47MQY8_MERPO|nr:hypothetical protein N1851_017078 [Merluccius polli]
MNTACAYETERQNKKKLLGQPRPATIHAVQSSDTPVEKSDKSPGQQNSVKLPPTVALQLEAMRSEMAVLRDLKAEIPRPNNPSCSLSTPSNSRSNTTPHNVNCSSNTPPNSPSTLPHNADHSPNIPPQHQPQYNLSPRQSQRQYNFQQTQNQPQGYWFPPGPGQSGGTAQYQQRFAPQRSFPPPNRGRMKKCFGCQQRGTEEYCTHCFRCGSSEHYLAGCRVRGQQEQFGGEPLNEDGSLAWGRE